ncbi:MAG: hypothetical protein KBT36_12440 [Kurthia sp.]|nr:hypothetical protein [Candidatus Kurthia equi]
MLETFDELNRQLSKHKGQVVTLDIKCPNCGRITKNADKINVDEHFDDYNSAFQFYNTHYFTCKHNCKREVRYSHINIRKIQSVGTLQEQVAYLIPYLEIERGVLWINSFTEKMLLVEPIKKIYVFSNPLKKAFIHATDLNEDLTVELNKLDKFRKMPDKDYSYMNTLKQFILREYPSVRYPAFYDPYTELEAGKVLDLDSLQFFDLTEVPLAQYTTKDDIEVGHFYLDAVSPNVAADKFIFDKSVDIEIAFMSTVFFRDAMKPRRLGQIVASSDKSLLNKYIELRLHPLYGEYVPVQITDCIPLMYQEEELEN